jgi:RNA polymerase sigma-70 factor, ECF subfamily
MPLSDEQLMLESSRGSVSAFELLVRRWDRRMLAYLRRCVGNPAEAEDLRQELFLKIYQKRALYRAGGAFSSWLYRIATNLVIDKHARKLKLLSQSIDELETDSSAPADESTADSRDRAALGEFEDRIFAALQRIPDNERIVLVLRHFENRNFKEIAELTNEPESTIKSRVYRGLQTMRSELKRAGIIEADCSLSA